MQKSTKKVDALGFDKWQIADIRRANTSNKSTYTKMNRLAEKIQKLGEEYKALEEELSAWEGPVKVITNKVLGIELNSQQVLAYHENPMLFAEEYPEHPQAAAIKEASSTPLEEETEAPAQPVDDIPLPEEEPVF